MEKHSATIEVSPSRDLSDEIKSFGNDSSCGGNKEGFSMPICFLVKEQAKSHIAIKELQKRLNRVESVQEDVVDAIIEFRNYLSDTKSFSSTNPMVTSNSLSLTKSPSNDLSKLNSSPKSNENVPSATESSVEIPNSVVKTRSYLSKDCDQRFRDYSKLHTIGTVPELSQKHLDLIKNKDSALESDKQDSGLDSDCREHHEIHPSICKNVSNHDSNDELLQLLDEIGYRSTVLQRQLALAEETTTLVDIKDTTPRSRSAKSISKVNSSLESKSNFLEVSHNGLMTNRDQSKLTSPTGESRRFYSEENVPMAMKQNTTISGLFEGKSLCDKRSPKRKAVNSFDSTVVSSILKETNVVHLQRQALIYLVDNAVLNTKLKEAEHYLSSKQVESEKIENTLKEEARLLMMENRELRISLDEQKIENTSLKSRLVMLERVVQSVSNENQELYWELSESLNLQNFPKRGSLNYSSSFRSENPVNACRPVRRPNLSSFNNDRNVNCVKSKLLSNNSSILDVTMEDPVNPASSAAFRFRNRPIHSSTPMAVPQKKNMENGVSKSPNLNDISASNFHTFKKCLKSSYGCEQGSSSQASKSGQCLDEAYSHNIPETGVKSSSPNSQDDTLPLSDSDKAFPFSTILEKLKSNSEYRLSKSASAKTGELCRDTTESSQLRSPVNNSKLTSSQDSSNISHFKEIKPSQENSADVILQRKKGRNIQQRIQNILDRIVAESEEAS
ncbi:uncharacterized protein CDAR_110241 [Caerostris darwini]|uniref:Uncharacterized protein n=1 Tax=Caerostris darwini TaxID=1538125 RepID=A0AAV4VMH6_9ARAC|nr:uncharacterized protein CDAR_110241 [Caerostris darwini]